MPPDYYCGIGNIPKGRRKGTLKECFDSNQIRNYGIDEVNEQKLNRYKELRKRNKKPTEKQLEKALDKKFIKVKDLEFLAKKLAKNFRSEKDKTKKKDLKKEYDFVYDEWKNANNEYIEFKNNL